MDVIQEYARYSLSATLRKGRIRLSATSVTEKHKDRVFKHWQEMGAKDIQCVAVEEPKDLPIWDVRFMAKGGKQLYHYAIVSASSKEVVERLLKNRASLKFIRIETCIRQEPALLSILCNPKIIIHKG